MFKKIIAITTIVIWIYGLSYAYTGIDSSSTNGISNTTWGYTNINSAVWGLGIPEDPELVEALARMYTNNITSLGTSSTYRPFDKITREESTKILWRFAKNILKTPFKTEITDEFCVFQDSGMIAKDFANDVKEACKLGLFRGGNGWFYPKWWLTKAQSLVVLIRLFDDKVLSENSDPWFKNYYDRAYELGITKDRDLTNFNREVTRYEIALMIYRFNIKYKLLKKTNNLLISSDQFLAILPDSITNSNGFRKGTALFNTDILTDPNKESFTFDLFGDKYMVKKRKIDNYGVGNNNYIWFWDLFTVDGNTFLGSANFTVLNGLIDEAYIRPSELGSKYYAIVPSLQQPYFTISEKSSQ